MSYPSRIVCLTEETTETLYLLGMADRIAGVSGYTARPPEARNKPRVSAFTHANYERIVALEPDLILGFSDLQAGVAAELIRRGGTQLCDSTSTIARVSFHVCNSVQDPPPLRNHRQTVVVFEPLLILIRRWPLDLFDSEHLYGTLSLLKR